MNNDLKKQLKTAADTNIFQSLHHLYDTSRMSDWPLMARIGKAQEELGEGTI